MLRRGIREYMRLRARTPAEIAAEVDEEIELHIELRARELVARGFDPASARAEAERRFGELTRTRSELQRTAEAREHRMRAGEWLASWGQDFRYSARALRREPLIATMIVVTLALGLGANATIFGIVDQLLLRGPAHVTSPEQVRRVYVTVPGPDGSPRTEGFTGYVTSTVLREGTDMFDEVAVYSLREKALFGRGEAAVEAAVGWATSGVFPLLGVRPALGRFFTEEETRPGQHAKVAVLEYGYWRSMYGGRANAIGETVVVDDAEYVIVGVAPEGFTGPDFTPARVWLAGAAGFEPTANWAQTWKASWVNVLVRLKPGVTIEQAEAASTAAFRAAATDAGATAAAAATLSLLPATYTRTGVEPPELAVSRWLMGVTLIVLLIACANVVNLLVARGLRRRREVAVRLALGVTRARLARLLMSESLLLAAAGGLLALVVVWAGGHALRTMLLPGVMWESALTGRVLLFGAAAVLLTGVLVGILPVLQAVGHELTDTLKSDSRGGGARRTLLPGTLTVLQSAFALVLLVGAALFVSSLWNVRSLDLGIEPDRVLVAWPAFPSPDDLPEAQQEAAHVLQEGFRSTVLERLRSRPDVIAASVAVSTPMRGTMTGPMRVEGWDSIPALAGGGPFRIMVGADYFETVGTRILSGRGIEQADMDGDRNVAVINDVMARTLWPDEDALGKCLYIWTSSDEPFPCSRVIGIAQETRRWQLIEDPAMQYYLPLSAQAASSGMLLVRTAGSPEAAIPGLRAMMHAMEPGLNFVDMSPLSTTLDPHIRPWRLGATMFLVFGALALLIAAIGLYSVIAYGVAQRRSELGIRIALGAGGRRIIGMIMRQGLGLVGLGIVLGLPIALLGARYIESLLFQTSARPLTFSIVALVLLLVATLATAVPAARAARTDPNVALRAD